MELRKERKKDKETTITTTLRSLRLLVALVVTFPLESTGLERKNAKSSPSCRRNAENVGRKYFLFSLSEHILSHFPPIFTLVMTIANSLDKDVFHTPFLSHSHSLSLSLSLFYHHSSRYINTLLDTLGTTDFTEIRDAFPFAEFLLSVKFHRSRITESRQVYRMSRKKRREISPSQFERLDLRILSFVHAREFQYFKFFRGLSPSIQVSTTTIYYGSTSLFRDIV